MESQVASWSTKGSGVFYISPCNAHPKKCISKARDRWGSRAWFGFASRQLYGNCQGIGGRKGLGFQVDAGLLGEDVADVAGEVELHVGAGVQSGNLGGGHVHGGDNQHHVTAHGGDVQVHGGAHHFGDVHGSGDAFLAQLDVLGTNAQNHLLRSHIVLGQGSLLGLGQLHGEAFQLHSVLAVLLHQLGVLEQVHLRSADEGGNEQVVGMVEHFLRSANLLDEAVLHDNDTVAQGHSLGLVVGNVDEGGVDALAQLNQLGTHLVTQLGVQVGQGLVHQHNLGVTDDSTADGNTLTLTAGQSLGLTAQVLGDVQDFGSFLHLLVDLVLGGVTQLQSEGHVVINGHVGIQSIVLENHGDIAVLGGNVVHQTVADVQLAAGDVFQAGNHTQGGGLTAAGRTDQNDEFLVGDVQVELLNGHNALIGNLQVGLLLLGLALLVLLGLFGVVAIEGVDLLQVFQG